MLLLTPVAGLAVAGLAIAYRRGHRQGSSEVLFSGQSALGPLIAHSASYTRRALLLLLACKGLAYGVSLSSFRGGPTFPALFLGAAGGDRAVAPAGPAADRRRRHGHRRDVAS